MLDLFSSGKFSEDTPTFFQICHTVVKLPRSLFMCLYTFIMTSSQNTYILSHTSHSHFSYVSSCQLLMQQKKYCTGTPAVFQNLIYCQGLKLLFLPLTPAERSQEEAGGAQEGSRGGQYTRCGGGGSPYPGSTR